MPSTLTIDNLPQGVPQITLPHTHTLPINQNNEFNDNHNINQSDFKIYFDSNNNN